jgi:charged multivesicular body protein 7
MATTVQRPYSEILKTAVQSSPLFSDKRKISLYSDFRRLQDINPEGYDANIAAWQSVLVDATVKGGFPDKTLLFADSSSMLNDLYDPKHGIPLALDVVIDDMVAEGTLIPSSDYMSRAASIYYKPWINASALGMVKWAFSKTGLYDPAFHAGSAGSLRREKYVVVKQLDAYSTMVLDCLRKLPGVGTIYSKSVFTRDLFDSLVASVIKEHCGETTGLTKDDFDCIVKYLTRDKKYMSINSEGIIKIIDLSTPDRISEITERDRAVASLRSTIAQVSDRVDRLSDSIQSGRIKASKALEVKNKTLAKYALRSTKMEEHAQEKALEMLQNLETVLSKIDEASDQIDVVNALQSGVQLLGTLNETVGGAERVGDLMDQVKEKMEDTDEITRELSQLTRPIDEDELEEQLNFMLQEELTKLPKIPSKLPSKVSSEQIDSLTNALQDSSLEENEVPTVSKVKIPLAN